MSDGLVVSSRLGQGVSEIDVGASPPGPEAHHLGVMRNRVVKSSLTGESRGLRCWMRAALFQTLL